MEKCHWRPRGPNDHPQRHRPGQCLVDYDIFADRDDDSFRERWRS
jgi:hypothetical protein